MKTSVKIGLGSYNANSYNSIVHYTSSFITPSTIITVVNSSPCASSPLYGPNCDTNPSPKIDFIKYSISTNEQYKLQSQSLYSNVFSGISLSAGSVIFCPVIGTFNVYSNMQVFVGIELNNNVAYSIVFQFVNLAMKNTEQYLDKKFVYTIATGQRTSPFKNVNKIFNLNNPSSVFFFIIENSGLQLIYFDYYVSNSFNSLSIDTQDSLPNPPTVGNSFNMDYDSNTNTYAVIRIVGTSPNYTANLYLLTISNTISITTLAKLTGISCGNTNVASITNMNPFFVAVCGSKIYVYYYNNNQFTLNSSYVSSSIQQIHNIIFLPTTVNEGFNYETYVSYTDLSNGVYSSNIGVINACFLNKMSDGRCVLVPSCPPNYFLYKEFNYCCQYLYSLSMKTCVVGCKPSEYMYNNTCYSTCPTTPIKTYPSESDRKCYATCPKVLNGAKCTDACDKNNYQYKGVCYPSCSVANIKTIPDPLNFTCYDSCPVYTDIDTNTCVNNCTVNKALFNNTQCLTNCPDPTKYKDLQAGVCTDSCQNFTDLDTSTCVSNCGNKFIYDKSYCSWNCQNTPNQTFANPWYKTCIPSCPTLVDADSFLCVNICDSNKYLFNKTCFTTCPSDQNLKTYPSPSDKQCYTACPFFLNDNICVTQCNSNQYVYNKICYSNCPQTPVKTYTNNNDKMCYTECPQFSDFDQGICVSSCGSKYVYNSKFCYTSCPSTPVQTYIYGSTCVTNCPKFADFTTLTCVDSCGSNKYNYNNICYSTCPSSPVQTYPNPTDMKCYITCPLFQKGGQCVNSCNQGQYKIGNVCYDTCPSTPVQTYVNPVDNTCVAVCPIVLKGSTCSDKCDSNEWTFNKVCYSDCQSTPSPSIPDPLTKTCYSKCPLFQDENENKCVNSCASNKFIYKGICKDACPTQPPTFILNNGCYDSCTLSTPPSFQEAVGSSKCVVSCPFYNFQGLCVNQCNNNFVTDFNTCMPTCPLGKYVYNKQCYYSCSMTPKKTYQLGSSCVENPCIANKTLLYSPNNTCTVNCPVSNNSPYYIDPQNFLCINCNITNQYLFNNTCVNNCPYPYKENIFTKVCVDCITPGLKFFNGTCLSQCPLYYVYNYLTNSCVSCQVYSKVWFNGECVDFSTIQFKGVALVNSALNAYDTCKNLKMYYLNGICYTACPPTYPIADQFGNCVNLFSENLYITNGVTSTSCPKYYFANETNRNCFNCKSIGKIYHNNTCVSTCPIFMSPDANNVCDTCTNNKLYSYNGLCVSTCPNNTVISSETKTCIDCGSSNKVFYNKACLDSCPMYAENKNNVCYPCIWTKTFFYQGTCNSKCPQYTVQYYESYYCQDVDRFSQNISYIANQSSLNLN